MTAYNRGRDDVFTAFIEIIRSRKLLVLIGIAAVFITTAIGVYLMPSGYKATTKIMIGSPPIPRGDFPIFSELRTGAAFVNNQKELIRSKFIYEKVVMDLGLYKMDKPPSMLKRVKKKFLKIDSTPFDEAVESLYRDTSVDILRGTNIVQITANALSSHQAAEIANAIARTYIVYINALLTDKTQSAYKMILSEQQVAIDRLQGAQQNLKGYMERENIISMTYFEGMIAISRNKLNELGRQYDLIEEEMHYLESGNLSEAPLSSMDNNVRDQSTYLGESQKMKQMENELSNLRNELQVARMKNTENHPKVKKLRDDVSKWEELLAKEREIYIQEREEFQRERETISRQREAAWEKKKVEVGRNQQSGIQQKLDAMKMKRDRISKQIQEENKNLKKLAKNASELTKLTQEANIREREYMMLREQMENTRFLKPNEEGEKEGSIRFIDPARPPAYPDIKKKMVLLAVGFMGSVIFGLGMAFIAEYADDSLKNREDAEKYLQLPILGAVPPIPKKVLEGKRQF